VRVLEPEGEGAARTHTKVMVTVEALGVVRVASVGRERGFLMQPQ